jgi:hypothetical protein
MVNLKSKENYAKLEETHQIFNYLNFILFEGIENGNDEKLLVPSSAKIDPIRQDILKHLDAYILGVNLIKDSIFVLDDEENEFGDQLKELFKSCFNFLKNFVIKNYTNQL